MFKYRAALVMALSGRRRQKAEGFLDWSTLEEREFVLAGRLVEKPRLLFTLR